MKVTSAFIFLNILNITFTHCRRVVGEGKNEVNEQHNVNLKRAIKNELEVASDQIVEIIAQHVEKLLQEQHGKGGASFLQEGWKTTARKITKSAAVQIAKTTVPALAAIVAESVKPPATDPTVYEVLFKPVCKDIFNTISTKLHIKPDEQIWNYKPDDDDDDDDDEDDVDFFELD